MRPLAWWKTKRSTSSSATPARSHTSRVDCVSAATAALNVVWPSMRMSASSRPMVIASASVASEPNTNGPTAPSPSAPSTTAPAASPNSAAVRLSSKSVKRESTSAPTTSTVSARPLSIMPAPELSALTHPVQAAPTSNAFAPAAPSAVATIGAALGSRSSAEVVATSTASRAAGSTPASSTAARAAAIARSPRPSEGMAWRRERMPVRFTIQLSSSPRRSAIGRFETAVSGRTWARPRTVAVRVAAAVPVTASASGALRMGGLPRDALGQLREHVAGARLHEVLGARVEHGAERLAPPHGPGQGGGQLGAHVGEGRGGRARVDGEARLAQLDVVERGAERRDGGLHRRRVERAGDVERHRAHAVLARGLLGLGEARALAREHDLAGGVVVGDGDLGGRGDRAGVVGGAAEQREHRAAVVGLGHQAAAQDDEAQRVLDRQHARGGERAELAERVAGGHGGLDVEHGPAGDARTEDGRLGEARALLHALEGILADQLDAALEQPGQLAGDVVAHVGGLGALAGEEQGDVRCRGHVPHRTPSERCVTAFWRSHPPGGGICATRWGVTGFRAMPLGTVTATRYVTPLREGGSLPAIVEADDDGLYVLKFRGAGQGVKALVAEVIGGELARALGLAVPEIVGIEVDPALGAAEPDPEIQDLIG